MPTIHIDQACRTLLAVLLMTLGATACSVSDLVNSPTLPPDVRDPSALQTPAGAISAYNAALLTLATTMASKSPVDEAATQGSGNLPSLIYGVGLMTDELQWIIDIGSADDGFPNTGSATVSSRTAPENDFSTTGRRRAGFYTSVYSWLQTTRARSRDAAGALQKYAPDAPKALIGHMYAVEGFAEVLLAELYCSGIPLSTLNFEGQFVYSPAISTDSVYRHAIARLDSALILAADSARIVHFANLVRSRALLNMGEFAAAAHGVTDVPTDYQYSVSYSALRPNMFYASVSSSYMWVAHVGDSIGINGIKYPGDPRSDTARSYASTNATSLRFIPKKFLPAGTVPTSVTVGGVTYSNYVNPGTASVPLAMGVEARLVEAEAALQQGSSTWLTILNTLRTTCTTTVGCPTPAPAGSGGYEGLPPLADPGTPEARLSLLFSERAHWLFLSGHRQGDLRRLVHVYQRPMEQVYPIGPWGTFGLVQFGADVNFPVPVEEQELNPLYHGCLNRDA